MCSTKDRIRAITATWSGQFDNPNSQWPCLKSPLPPEDLATEPLLALASLDSKASIANSNTTVRPKMTTNDVHLVEERGDQKNPKKSKPISAAQRERN